MARCTSRLNMRPMHELQSFMHEIDLLALDLNLLAALEVLLEEGHVGRAARRLGRSQSATSHILARLRDTLNDPLLVRDGSRMRRTPRAEALVEPLGLALDQLRAALRPAAMFDPATSERAFVLAVHDLVLPSLTVSVSDIVRTAPGIQLRIRGHINVDPPPAGIDLMTFGHTGAPTSWRTRALADTGWSTVVRHDHPWLREPTLTHWLAYPHVQIWVGREERGPVEKVLHSRGLPRRVAVVAPHFLGALQLVATSDLLLTVPIRPASDTLGPLRLTSVPAPLELPALRSGLAWPPRLEPDPGHRWLRARLARELDALGARASGATGQA